MPGKVETGAFEAWQAQAAQSPVFDVLLEIGLPGGRTGVREHDAALALARVLNASPANIASLLALSLPTLQVRYRFVPGEGVDLLARVRSLLAAGARPAPEGA